MRAWALTRFSCLGSDNRALSAFMAITLVGGALSVGVAGFAMTQTQLLAQRADPATSDVVDAMTIHIATGEVLGHVDKVGEVPAIDHLVITTKLGLATEAFDLRTLTLRIAGPDNLVVLGHPSANGTVAGAAFTPVAVRDQDGSLADHRMERGDRLDLEIDLAALGMSLERGQSLTIFFQTDGSTSLRLKITAPSSFAASQWVELERAVLQHA